MTAKEFKAWLDGYIMGGGADVSEIVKKAQSIETEHALLRTTTYPYFNGGTTGSPYRLPEYSTCAA